MTLAEAKPGLIQDFRPHVFISARPEMCLCGINTGALIHGTWAEGTAVNLK